MNICEYILKNNIPHTKGENGTIIQNGDLNLSFNEITNLDNFIQNGYLNLSHNKITSLDNFIQNGALDLDHNQITSLDNFIQNGILYLCTWRTQLKDNILTIGCKSKSLEDWDEFFKLKKSYGTDPNSEKYREIEKAFKLYKNQK